MKIKMYEVREDEKKAIERVAEELGADVSISSNILTPQEAESLRGIDGVSILGRTTVNKELLDGLKKAGVGYVSTRTVGYNHMDVAYAAEVGIRPTGLLSLRSCSCCWPCASISLPCGAKG